MEPRHALQVLGLHVDASRDDVKRAYRRLARDHHPDAGGDAATFHRVREAFEELAGGVPELDVPGPQEVRASVEERWWEAPGVFHDAPVDTSLLDDAAPPDTAAAAVVVDRATLARLLLPRDDASVGRVTLRSRGPGAWLNRVIAWLQPDLLTRLDIGPATSGPRPGHDVSVRLRGAAGPGRRRLATGDLPAGWTRRRGATSVDVSRDLRPARTGPETAVRTAQVVNETLDALDWPLRQWTLLGADHRGDLTSPPSEPGPSR